MQAGPSNAAISAASVSQIKKRRIPQAGIAIMEGESPSHPDGYQALILVFAAWLNQHGSNPTREDRNVMLYQIRLIPGGENYDDKGVIEWFKRRRRLANSPYRTLSSKALKHLTTLALSNPYPSPGLITTWAELLHASTDDITKWLAEHRSPVQHLPTPVSTSPEPVSLKADPINSPVIPSHNVPTFCSTHVREPHVLSDQQLVNAISEASRLKSTVPIIPKNMEEFESMFEPYRIRMEQIIHQNEVYMRPED